MNHYKLTDGTKISKSYIDRKIREAKALKLKQQFEELGYNVCTDCWNNDCLPIDVSHNISVDQCQKMGTSELAWDLDNLKIRGRKCHQKKDKLDLRFNN